MRSKQTNELWSDDASGKASARDILIICRHVVANLLINTHRKKEVSWLLKCLLAVIIIWLAVRGNGRLCETEAEKKQNYSKVCFTHGESVCSTAWLLTKKVVPQKQIINFRSKQNRWPHKSFIHMLEWCLSCSPKLKRKTRELRWNSNFFALLFFF